MREKTKNVNAGIKKHRRGRVWLWLIIVILLVCGAATWVLYDGGIIGNRYIPDGGFVAETVVEPKIGDAAGASDTAEPSIRPACAVVEDTLLKQIVDDDDVSYAAQEASAHIYSVLAQRGCPENSQLFADMSVRKQAIADGLRAVYEPENNAMRSVEYLYSDERVCKTLEKRVLQNIDTDAYRYQEFLDNANTYSVLYQYGCRGNKAAYSRAAVRELAIAMALQPAEHMTTDEITTVVEVYKRLGVANLAHLVLQRLKARGYDMDFLLSMEDIIHGMR